MWYKIRHAVIFVVMLSWGCTTTDGTRDQRTEEITDGVSPAEVEWTEVEDFDPGAYPDERPVVSTKIDHDVPETLMAGRIPEARTRSSRGFRIQVFNTIEKTEADRQVARLIDWWRSRKRSGASGGLFVHEQPPVYTVYRQPYYRIRIGNFSSREQADRALGQVASQFPGALVVPDQVSVRR